MASVAVQIMFATFTIGYAKKSGVARSDVPHRIRNLLIHRHLCTVRIRATLGQNRPTSGNVAGFAVFIVPILITLSAGNAALVNPRRFSDRWVHGRNPRVTCGRKAPA
jgi:hypothetical protein